MSVLYVSAVNIFKIKLFVSVRLTRFADWMLQLTFTGSANQSRPGVFFNTVAIPAAEIFTCISVVMLLCSYVIMNILTPKTDYPYLFYISFPEIK